MCVVRMTRDEAEAIFEDAIMNPHKKRTTLEYVELNKARKVLKEELEEILEDLPKKLREQIKRRL